MTTKQKTISEQLRAAISGADVSRYRMSKDLDLRGLTTLSEDAAESLSIHNGVIHLELDKLPAPVAEILRDAGHGDG